MIPFWTLFPQHRGRICEKWKHYFPIYERHFSSFRTSLCTVLEIGVGQGGSLQLWKKYFGPLAQIIGIDINERCREFEEEQIRVRIGDQSDEKFLASVLNEIGPPDIVIDDGSHMQAHVRTSFDFLYPRLSNTGVYLVEDLHAAYWPEFGPGSFIEHTKGLIDKLNAHHARGAVGPDNFTYTTDAIHVYDSVVVFEKWPHPAPTKVMSGCFK